MANIAVQRIKREFKEVLKSEEVGYHVCLYQVSLLSAAQQQQRVACIQLISDRLALADWYSPTAPSQSPKHVTLERLKSEEITMSSERCYHVLSTKYF